MIPMAALGIPGDSTTALLIGALTIHGLEMGPMVFRNSGDVVYLAKLKNRNWKARKYTVAEGETVRDVALRFAVKPDRILKMNKLSPKAKVHKGQELWLR